MHSKFALRPHHVWEYGRHPISEPTRLGEEKRQKQDKNIMFASATQGGHKERQDENIMPALFHRAAIIKKQYFGIVHQMPYY